MANDTDDEVRRLFTEIGCIMEGASSIAIVWQSEDGMDVSERYRKIAEAHTNIGALLSIIGKLS